MADVMNLAEVHDQSVELLPPRTVLSLVDTVQTGLVGVPGDPGTRGANGESLIDTTWNGLFSPNDQSTRPIGGPTDSGGKIS